jgi:hypothetical protein
VCGRNNGRSVRQGWSPSGSKQVIRMTAADPPEGCGCQASAAEHSARMGRRPGTREEMRRAVLDDAARELGDREQRAWIM